MDLELPHSSQVCVVVIGYNDASHVTDAVRSALRQGSAVREVIAVDDCSTDGSGDVLQRLAVEDPRLRVIRRVANSGGCGTPRNDGIAACTSPYVIFLDSDDVLPPGAVTALLNAAVAHRADIASGLCVRRELPPGRDKQPLPTGGKLRSKLRSRGKRRSPSQRLSPSQRPALTQRLPATRPAREQRSPCRESPWLPELHERPAVVARPDRRPALVRDALCVGKLYRTAFLRDHAIRFPDGRFPYEDVVFSACVLAAAPRIALVPDTVYVWHVRRAAAQLSISLDRSGVDNWRARTAAHRQAVEILLAAGEKRLARAARAHSLDHPLRMYARELELRGPGYQRAWWSRTRAYLETFDAADFEPAPAPGRVIARVVLASDEPRDLARLKELASRPARLLPPYARAADGTPVWSPDLPQVSLDHLLLRPMRMLPVAVDAELRPRARATRLRLRLHELYGRVADAGPESVDVEFRDRQSGRAGLRRTVSFVRDPDDGDSWSAEAVVDLPALGAGVWDLRLRLRFHDGTQRETTAHATAGPGRLRRSVLPCHRHGVLLVQPYATHSGSLALRLAPGLRGMAEVARRRVARLVH